MSRADKSDHSGQEVKRLSRSFNLSSGPNPDPNAYRDRHSFTYADKVRTLLAARRHPWLTLSSVIAGTALALVALLLTPPTYHSSSVINVAASPTVAAADLFGSNRFVQQRASTIAALVTTDTFVDEVAAQLPGEDTPNLTASVRQDTSLLSVEAAGSSPEGAQQAATVATDLLVARARALDEGLGGVPTTQLVVVEAAALPRSASQPVAWVFVAVGLLLGAAVGFAVLRLRMRSDNRVSRPSDLVEISGDTGAVFWMPDRRWNGASSGPRHAEYAERLAAVHQEFLAMPGRDSRILLIAAPSQAHAETAHQVADDLSTTLVWGGRRVVLLRLDGDEQDEHRPGLSDVLAGSHSMKQVIFRDLVGRFDVGPGQQVLRLLTATEREIRAVMGQLLAVADLVIIDAPPLSSPVGFPVMSQIVDAVLVTATPKDVRTDELMRAKSTVERLRVRYLGLMLAPREPLPMALPSPSPARASASTGARPEAGSDEGLAGTPAGSSEDRARRQPVRRADVSGFS